MLKVIFFYFCYCFYIQCIFAPVGVRRKENTLFNEEAHYVSKRGIWPLTVQCPLGWQKLGPLHLFRDNMALFLCALQAIKKVSFVRELSVGRLFFNKENHFLKRRIPLFL